MVGFENLSGMVEMRLEICHTAPWQIKQSFDIAIGYGIVGRCRVEASQLA